MSELGSARRMVVRLARVVILGVITPIVLLVPATANALATTIDVQSAFQLDTNDAGELDGALIARYGSWGETYLAGGLNGSIRLVSPGGPRTITSSGDESSYVAKYDGAGNVDWQSITQPGTSSYSYPTAIAVDSDGALIVSGVWTGTVTFDGVGGSDTRNNGHDTNSGVRDTYVTKYDANGVYQWTVTTDTPGTDRWATSTSLAVDSSGSIFVGGTFVGEVTFDGESGTHSLDAGNNSNGFLMKLNSSGAFQYVYAPDNSDPTDGDPSLSTLANVTDIALDSNEDIYLTGVYSGTVTFGGSDTFNANGTLPYITKLANDGTYQQTTTFHNADSDSAFADAVSIALTSDDRIYLLSDNSTGHFSIDGTETLSPATSSIQLYKLDNDGTATWWRTLATPDDSDAGYTDPSDLIVDAADNVYVTGTYGGSAVHFDTTCANVAVAAPAGSENAFITAYSAAGNYAFTQKPEPVDTASWVNGLSLARDGSTLVLGAIYQGDILVDGLGGHFDRHPYYTDGISFLVASYSITSGSDVLACTPPVDDGDDGSNDPGTSEGESSGSQTPPDIGTQTPLALVLSNEQTDDSSATPTPTPEQTPVSDIPSDESDAPSSGPDYTWAWVAGLGVPIVAIIIFVVRLLARRS